MKVVITGGAGFLGSCAGERAARAARATGARRQAGAIDELVLFDMVRAGAIPARRPRVTVVIGDIADAGADARG